MQRRGYNISCDGFHGGYDYQEYKPFYALGNDYRVAAFDVPVSGLSSNLNGLKFWGRGGHFPFVPSVSESTHVLPDIIEKYEKNPVLRQDGGNWWHDQYKQWVQGAIADSLTICAQICQDLLQQGPWDLFVAGFGETHTAGHDLYDRSQPDHLHNYLTQGGGRPDPMLAAYQQVDETIGKILQSVPEDAYVMIFAVHGMGANLTDQLSMFFLAEVLYRFNFPGQVALAPRELGKTPPPPIAHPIPYLAPFLLSGLQPREARLQPAPLAGARSAPANGARSELFVIPGLERSGVKFMSPIPLSDFLTPRYPSDPLLICYNHPFPNGSNP